MVVNWCIYCLSNKILQVFEAQNLYSPLPSLRVILCNEVEQNFIENLWKNDVNWKTEHWTLNTANWFLPRSYFVRKNLPPNQTHSNRLRTKYEPNTNQTPTFYQATVHFIPNLFKIVQNYSFPFNDFKPFQTISNNPKLCYNMQLFSIVLFDSNLFQLSDYQYFMIVLLIFRFIFDSVGRVRASTAKNYCVTHKKERKWELITRAS